MPIQRRGILPSLHAGRISRRSLRPRRRLRMGRQREDLLLQGGEILEVRPGPSAFYQEGTLTPVYKDDITVDGGVWLEKQNVL